jgi:hypothetical protein
VRAFFGKDKPTTTKGKFALARVPSAGRPRHRASLREAWRNDEFSGELEGRVLDVFMT